MNKTLKKNLVILGAVTAASFGVSGAAIDVLIGTGKIAVIKN